MKDTVYFTCTTCGTTKGRLVKQVLDFEEQTVVNTFVHGQCPTRTDTKSNLYTKVEPQKAEQSS